MKKKGFTLIELLVVIAIIGLLSTLAVVALNSARAKARDAKRVGDVKQMQTALELYYNDNQSYPPCQNCNTTDDVIGVKVNCLGSDGTDSNSNPVYGFNWGVDTDATKGCAQPIYMGLVPKNPTPGGADYVYNAGAAGGGICQLANYPGPTGTKCGTYSITFSLEGKTGDLAAGAHTATPVGVQ